MGLLNRLRKLKRSEKEARILVLGLDNAGKTTILKKLSDEAIDTITPTKGFNVKSITVKGFKVNMWHVGGQKSIRTYWRNYYDNTDVLIYVVDSADVERLSEATVELNQLLKEKKLKDVPLLVFANKMDLLSATTPAMVSKHMDLRTKAAKRTHSIMGCSAKTGDGLVDGMRWVIDHFELRNKLKK